jgi:hypothetical protein
MGVKSTLEQVCCGVWLTVERDCQEKLHTRASLPLEDSLKSLISGAKAQSKARLPQGNDPLQGQTSGGSHYGGKSGSITPASTSHSGIRTPDARIIR